MLIRFVSPICRCLVSRCTSFKIYRKTSVLRCFLSSELCFMSAYVMISYYACLCNIDIIIVKNISSHFNAQIDHI